MTPRIPLFSVPASLAALAMALFVACSESPTTPAPPPPPACTFALSATSLSVPASGGPSVITVTAGATCTWTAQTTSPWLTITGGASGTGNGVVSVTAQPNPDTAMRTGTLTVAGLTVTVVQAAADPPTPCAFAITPTTATSTADGVRGTVAVSTTATCAWQVVQNAPWIRLVTGQSGTGPGTVEYAVDANPTAIPRTGTLTIAGLLFTLHQDGDVSACTYEVSPVQFQVCMTWSDRASQITTQDGCPWSAASTVDWITVAGAANRTGSGTLILQGEDNWLARRTGIVEVRWPAATAGQNIAVDQGGCSYAVTRPEIVVAAPGGTEQFEVWQQSDPIACGGPLQNACLWSAVSNVPWITVTTSMPRTGDDRVTLVVAVNPSSTPRVGTVTVRDKTVTVTQGGQ